MEGSGAQGVALETIQQTNQVSATGAALPDGSKTTATTDRAAVTAISTTLRCDSRFSGWRPRRWVPPLMVLLMAGIEIWAQMLDFRMSSTCAL